MQSTFLGRSGPSSKSALSRNNELFLWSDAAAMKRLANQFDRLISTMLKAYPMQPLSLRHRHAFAQGVMNGPTERGITS